MKEGANNEILDSIVIPKAIGVCKSLFHVCTPKETKRMSISLPCVEQVDQFSHCQFCLAMVVGRAWKAKLTQQWIHLFMENLMMQVASW